MGGIVDKQSIGRPIAFSLSPPIAAVVILLAIGLVAAFVTWDAGRSELIYGAAVLAGSSALYSAYYAAAAIRLQIYRDQQARAFEFINQYNQDARTRPQVYSETLNPLDDLSPKELEKKIAADPELRDGVRGILNSFEEMAIAVRTGYADEQVAFFFFVSILPFAMRRLGAYISSARTEEDNLTWVEAERLAEAWRAGTSVIDKRALASTT
jgi:hypothetical protein